MINYYYSCSSIFHTICTSMNRDTKKRSYQSRNIRSQAYYFNKKVFKKKTLIYFNQKHDPIRMINLSKRRRKNSCKHAESTRSRINVSEEIIIVETRYHAPRQWNVQTCFVNIRWTFCQRGDRWTVAVLVRSDEKLIFGNAGDYVNALSGRRSRRRKQRKWRWEEGRRKKAFRIALGSSRGSIRLGPRKAKQLSRFRSL